MEDRWRHWIAKCLVIGNSDSSILNKLEKEGYDLDTANQELEKAKLSPYIKGAKEVFDRETQKADPDRFELEKSASNQTWLLRTYEKLARLDPEYGKIQRIVAPTFEKFVEDYISKNRPVIIVNAMEDWVPFEKWSLDYFREVHGDVTVNIQDGRETNSHYEQNQKYLRKDVLFSAFLDRLKATESSNDFYMTAGNMSGHKESLPQIFADAENVNIRDSYFGERPEGSLWIGPRGTVTPLHIDMINNFFCQIVGRKRVRLVPSWSLPFVYNDYHVYSDVDASAPDFEAHPLFKEATVYDFVVKPGEILFIPVGWWHHLTSLDISVSLTRKNLRLPIPNGFGARFIRESKNFKPSQT